MFELWDVTTQTFDMVLNQPVAAGVPAAGAGEIGGKGETDLYTLKLSEPHLVYLQSQGDCGGTYIRWQLDDASGSVVASADGLTDVAACFSLGPYSLPAGDFTVRVVATDGVGPYAFEAWDVPPIQTFPIALDQVVSTGQPNAGSGEITVPGERDVYPFAVSGPQTVYLMAKGDCGGTYIRWHLLDGSGTVVAADDGTKDVAVCFNLGAYTLQAGSYQVEVFTTDGVGTYSFVVSSSPPST